MRYNYASGLILQGNVFRNYPSWHTILLIYNMNNDNQAYKVPQDSGLIQRLKFELAELERELVDIEGKMMKPSQCYHLELDPVHVLYNTNCPGTLKERIDSILAKYLRKDETGTQE